MQPETTVQTTQALPPAKPSFFNVKFFVLVFCGLAVVSAVVVVVLNNMKQRSEVAQQQPAVVTPPAPSSSSTSLVISAPKSSFMVGDRITASVLVKSDNDAANLFVAKMRFPADLLQVVNVDFKPKLDVGQVATDGARTSFISNWFVTNWVENTFNNNTGAVSLVGGVPNPGFQTSPDTEGALMADIIFEAKRPGSATVSFDATSSIYRNSDNANILKTKKDLDLEITEATLTATPSASMEGDINEDGEVDLTDLSALFTFWSKVGPGVGKADLNKDSMVNTFDFSTLSNILVNLRVINDE